MRVVVIGGGGAGLLAAIAAREAGAEVLLVSKTPVGLAGCTTYAGGGFTVGVGGLSEEEHRKVTLEAGRGINDERLVDALVRQGPDRVLRLSRYGVRLRTGKGRALVGQGMGELMRGRGMTGPLAVHARNIGVRFRERAAVTDIVMRDGFVAGVRVYDFATGSLEMIPCAAAVVASGGGGRIYGRTDNPIRTTGDGYYLLAQVGATFRDMEFVQFYPIGLDEPGAPVWMVDLGLMDYCRLTDAGGRRFLNELFEIWGIRSGTEANLVARDRCAVEIALKVKETGRVLLHLNEVDESKITSSWHRDSFACVSRMYPQGRSRRDGPISVSPIQHYFCGGAVVDERGWTGVPGVYACGEVAGGVDGANRVGGNALTNLAVFGPAAGEAAARFALGPAGRSGAHGDVGGIDAGQADSSRWRRTAGGVKPAELKRRINLLCDEYLGPIRDEQGLIKAIDGVRSLKGELERVSASDPREVLDALEARAMLVTAEMVAVAALKRKESRGVHFRSDYPREDPAFAAPLFVGLEDDGVVARSR